MHHGHEQAALGVDGEPDVGTVEVLDPIRHEPGVRRGVLVEGDDADADQKVVVAHSNATGCEPVAQAD